SASTARARSAKRRTYAGSRRSAWRASSRRSAATPSSRVISRRTAGSALWMIVRFSAVSRRVVTRFQPTRDSTTPTIRAKAKNSFWLRPSARTRIRSQATRYKPCARFRKPPSPTEAPDRVGGSVRGRVRPDQGAGAPPDEFRLRRGPGRPPVGWRAALPARPPNCSRRNARLLAGSRRRALPDDMTSPEPTGVWSPRAQRSLSVGRPVDACVRPSMWLGLLLLATLFLLPARSVAQGGWTLRLLAESDLPSLLDDGDLDSLRAAVTQSLAWLDRQPAGR